MCPNLSEPTQASVQHIHPWHAPPSSKAQNLAAHTALPKAPISRPRQAFDSGRSQFEEIKQSTDLHVMQKKNLQIRNGYTSLFPMGPDEFCFFCIPYCQESLDLSPP